MDIPTYVALMDQIKERHAAPSLVRVRVCLIGDVHVGKTSLIQRFVGEPFGTACPVTVGASMRQTYFNTEDDSSQVCVYLNDTSGQERFRLSLTSSFVRAADCILVCFDLTSQESLDALRDHWLPWSMDSACGAARHIVVGLKADLKRDVAPYDVLHRWAYDIGCGYFETSAKTGQGIEPLTRHIGSTRNDMIMCTSMSITTNSIINLRDDNNTPCCGPKHNKAKRGCSF